MSTVRVACHQLAPVIGDLEGNRARALAAIDAAAAAGAQVVVLPELASVRLRVPRRRRGARARRARRRPDASPAGRSGRPRTASSSSAASPRSGGDGRLYNSAALVDASGVRAVYRKVAPVGSRVARVHARRRRRRRWSTRRTAGSALMVCYDLEFPEWVRIAALARRRTAVRPDQLAARAAPRRRATDGGAARDGRGVHEPHGGRRLRPLRRRARHRAGSPARRSPAPTAGCSPVRRRRRIRRS